MGKLRIFLQDWCVFIGFLYLFDSLRGTIYIATCRFGLPVYTTYVIKLEELLFGCISSVYLQKLLLHNNSSTQFSWFEKFVTVIHGSHFVAFLLIGFIIWLYKSDYFRFLRFLFIWLFPWDFWATWLFQRSSLDGGKFFGSIPPHFSLCLVCL